MAGTVCITIDGVLSKGSKGPLPQRQANPTAVEFFDVLKGRYRTALLMSEDVRSYDRTAWWLQQQNFTGYDVLVPAAEDAQDEFDCAYRQVTQLRAQRTEISLLISAEPLVVTMAMVQGIHSLLWAPARPAIMRGDLRKHHIRAWDPVEQEIINQREHA